MDRGHLDHALCGPGGVGVCQLDDRVVRAAVLLVRAAGLGGRCGRSSLRLDALDRIRAAVLNVPGAIRSRARADDYVLRTVLHDGEGTQRNTAPARARAL